MVYFNFNVGAKRFAKDIGIMLGDASIFGCTWDKHKHFWIFMWTFVSPTVVFVRNSKNHLMLHSRPLLALLIYIFRRCSCSVLSTMKILISNQSKSRFKKYGKAGRQKSLAFDGDNN